MSFSTAYLNLRSDALLIFISLPSLRPLGLSLIIKWPSNGTCYNTSDVRWIGFDSLQLFISVYINIQIWNNCLFFYMCTSSCFLSVIITLMIIITTSIAIIMIIIIIIANKCYVQFEWRHNRYFFSIFVLYLFLPFFLFLPFLTSTTVCITSISHFTFLVHLSLSTFLSWTFLSVYIDARYNLTSQMILIYAMFIAHQIRKKSR